MKTKKRGNYIFFNFRNSLLLWIIGIFLFSNLIAGNALASEVTAEKIMELTNLERVKYGLNELVENESLTKAAIAKASAIISQQNFSHNFSDKKFSDWIKEEGYEYSIVGENLAVNFTESEPMFNAWLASPSHRKNVLHENYQEAGVAVLSGEWFGEETIIAVELFGAPKISSEQLVLNTNTDQSFLKSQNSSPYFIASDLSEYYLNNINSKNNPMAYNAKMLDIENYENKSGALFKTPDMKSVVSYFLIIIKLMSIYILAMCTAVLFYFYINYINNFGKKLKLLNKV
ncbi:MAG: CAP domain-containing protein [Patescibacteria group bacterium]|jgi:hypothetical protein